MSDPSSRLAAFIAELKHRRVFRVAIVYAGVAFIIFQIIDAIFEPLNIPGWVGTTIIVLLLIGFPIAVALAWAFDITEKGIVRTRGKAQAPATSRRPILTNWTLGIVAALAIIVAVWALLREPSPGGAAITSIAVLPLENIMNDPEQDYFVDGMHDALISELGKISALRVIGRTSVLGYRDAPKPIPEIAQELKVDAVVEGSVLLVGGEVKITAQLVAASPERHLWTDSYTRSVSNVLSLHSEVARAIAREIGLALTPEEETRLASVPQVNPEAYKLYLQGWKFRNEENVESNRRAVELLEQAVDIDPDFAPAHAALAICYFMMGDNGFGVWPDARARARMNQAVERALELDDTLPDAYVYLGVYRYYNQWDFAGGEAAFKRALQLSPDHVHARYEYGLFLTRTGRHEEAMDQVRWAKKLDPLSPQPEQGIARVYFRSRQYEQALEHFSAALEREPSSRMVRNWTTGTRQQLLLHQGRYAEAAAEAEKLYAEADDEWEKSEALFLLLRAEWALGNREKVYSVRDSLRSTGELQQWEQEYPFLSAFFYGIMGEKEKALSLLEKAHEDSSYRSMFATLTSSPVFDSLRAEPRFKAIMQKMGLTEVFDQYGQRIR